MYVMNFVNAASAATMCRCNRALNIWVRRAARLRIEYKSFLFNFSIMMNFEPRRKLLLLRGAWERSRAMQSNDFLTLLA